MVATIAVAVDRMKTAPEFLEKVRRYWMRECEMCNELYVATLSMYFEPFWNINKCLWWFETSLYLYILTTNNIWQHFDIWHYAVPSMRYFYAFELFRIWETYLSSDLRYGVINEFCFRLLSLASYYYVRMLEEKSAGYIGGRNKQ